MTQPSEDQFAAALAHQLKTPMSALQASSTNLRRNLKGLLEDLASMAGPAASSGPIAHFISRAVSEHSPPPLTGLLPQDRLEVIARRLEEGGPAGDSIEAASRLVRGGWDTYLDEIVPLLGHDRSLALDLLDTAARLRANLTAIETSLARMRGLASALRALAGTATGAQVDLRATIESTVAILRPTLPPEVKLDLRLGDPPPVQARADLLAEIWSNLAANAAQAVGARGTIEIEARREGSPGRSFEAVVRVIDDGPGIDPGVQSRIFEPFFTTRALEGGTGLGLALARRIVEKMGGRISVQSRPGRTCFEVALPALMTAAQEKG